MFALKKFVSFWLMPLPFCLTLLALGWCLGFSRHRRKLGHWLTGLALLLLLAFSNKAVSTWLIRPLEQVYPPIPEFVTGVPVPDALARCRYVVVLGSGHGDTEGFSAVNKLSMSAKGRLMEGLRILRALPQAKLIVSGRGEPNFPTHAAVLEQAAISLGTPPGRILRLDTPRDTEEETLALKRMVGAEPFALVTSAWHLPRATALMRSAGLDPLPCPADYAARPSPTMRLTDYSWDTESLGRSNWAVYERLGTWWSKWRGKL